ncbi:MAG: tandem-95 repeat protein, partial [Candidatus Electrothrix sp. AW1]|nr:tandem-95 repeat protein [Candidatus Electrothrix gigas]
ITVSNTAPVAVNDTYSMVSNGTPIALLPLTSDSDPEGQPLTVTSINGTTLTPGTAQTIPVTNGSVNIDAAGNITFTPDTNYVGQVSFPYVISDGTETATANEIITVSNTAPVAVNDTYSMASNGAAITLTPLTGDSDPNGDTLAIVSINGTTLTPGTAQTIPVTNGTVNIDTAGNITFTPATDYTGLVSFPYVINDGTETATANEIITVSNTAPVAVNDTYSMVSNGTPIALLPLTSDSDPEGQPLTVTSINGTTLTPGTAQTIPVTNGSVNIDAAGNITFTPDTNYVGQVSFPYVISDGTETATANEIITVSNTAPVAVNDTYSMVSNGTPIALLPLTSDSDPEGQPLTV